MENKLLIDAKGKFVLNDGDLTGHIMCFENGYATVFNRFAKVVCKFSVLDAPAVDAVEVVHAQWVLADDDKLVCNHCKRVKVAYEQLCFFRSTGCWNYCPNCGAKMDR